jgi:hypothetical protein
MAAAIPETLTSSPGRPLIEDHLKVEDHLDRSAKIRLTRNGFGVASSQMISRLHHGGGAAGRWLTDKKRTGLR